MTRHDITSNDRTWKKPLFRTK